MHLLGNLRTSLRMLRSQPTLAAIAILTLGLGIGLTTTVFSIVNAALLKGLPFADPARIVVLSRTNSNGGQMGVTPHDFLDWEAQQQTFAQISAVTTSTMSISGDGRMAERRPAASMTPNAFELLGVAPILGRTFTAEESRRGGEPVAVIGYGLWQRAFGGAPDALGQTLRINGEPATVIGVMPAGFGFPFRQELWLPLRLLPLESARGAGGGMTVFGRLADGARLADAQSELSRIAAQIAADYPESNRGVGAFVQPFSRWALDDEIHMFLYTMLAASIAVLLIACVNVANLLLARAAARMRDMAIRIAVGASRGHIVAQLLTESLMLAALGAVLGVAFGQAGVAWFAGEVASSDPPFWLDFRMDWTVALFVVAAASLAGVAAGILPALQSSASKVNAVLKDESRGTSSLRMSHASRVLVITEIALSFALLVSAGLMARSIFNVRNFDPGIAADDVLVGNIGLQTAAYNDANRRREFWETLQRNLAARPEIASVTFSANIPGAGSSGGAIAIEGAAYTDQDSYPSSRWTFVEPEFFRTLGVEPRLGRVFETLDASSDDIPVVINRSFAARFFPDVHPLGRRLRTGGAQSQAPWMTVVGVVPDIPMAPLEGREDLSDNADGFYQVQRTANPPTFNWIVLRTRVPPLEVAATVRDAIRSIDSDIAMVNPNSMRQAITNEMWYVSVLGVLFVAFGLGALFLSAVGHYGIMAFSVRRRTAEIGIRMTLGATSGNILRLVLKQGLWQLGIGMAIGMGLAIFLARAIRMVLFAVPPTDVATFVYVAAGMSAIGFLASYIPARRAARLDPLVAIRQD